MTDKEEFYSVIISYDVSGERQSEVKNQLLKKGYVDTVTGDDRTAEPVIVKYCYQNGTEEKVADNICANCGRPC